MPGLVAAGFFRVIQVALLPIGAVGYVASVPRLLNYSRRTGVSATVFASLYTRYMQHRLGTRPDGAAARLMRVMPNVSSSGFRLESAPTMVAHAITGYVPRIYRYPYRGEPPLRHQQTARTTFYDAALLRHLPEVGQVVILGAGCDTRVFRLFPEGTLAPGNRASPENRASTENTVRCFEVDRPPSQAFKLRMLKDSGLATDLATYVAADFRTEDWFEKLVAAGFDPAVPAFFLWEAVTMYLDRASVESTLRRIAGTAAGSVIAFDYFSAEIIASRSPLMRYARAATKFTGEPLTFGLDNTAPAREKASEFLRAFGLTLEEHRNFGRETLQRPAPAGFLTAIVGEQVRT